MTREELDRLRSYLTHRIVHTERIDALYDHISRLERDARAGRELRNKLGAFAGPPGINMLIEAYDTATESKP